jgi:mono/diheme cytochrome c family protein
MRLAMIGIIGLSGLAALAATIRNAGALPPSAESGADLAARWCADCHMSAPDHGAPDHGAKAPSFAAISADRTAEQIRQSLTRPHARPMGGIALNKREAQDVAAFIKTLGR